MAIDEAEVELLGGELFDARRSNKAEMEKEDQDLSPGKWANLPPQDWAIYYLFLINDPIYKEKRKDLWRKAVKQGKHPLNHNKDATPLEAILSLWDLEEARKKQARLCEWRIECWAEEQSWKERQREGRGYPVENSNKQSIPKPSEGGGEIEEIRKGFQQYERIKVVWDLYQLMKVLGELINDPEAKQIFTPEQLEGAKEIYEILENKLFAKGGYGK